MSGKSLTSARLRARSIIAVSTSLLLIATQSATRAGSATWKLKPESGDWDTASNWTPATVPDGESDVATFARSQVTDVSISIGDTKIISLDSIVFSSNASAFTINTHESYAVEFYGAGVVNNSGITQQIVIPNTEVYFLNQSSAGGGILFTVNGGPVQGEVAFAGQSHAGTCTYVAEPAPAAFENGGNVVFLGGHGDHGYFMLQGSTVAMAEGGFGEVQIGDAGHGVFEMGGGQIDGAEGGFTFIDFTGHAGDATFICHGGLVAGAGGGRLYFLDKAHGDRARIELFGNSLLDISGRYPPGVDVGSIEGTGGLINLGANVLGIGTNDRTTKFAGIIRDGRDSGGQITKIGAGTLSLLGASTYTGGTTVEQGTLAVDNTTGSATGTGAVQVAAGTLSGRGTIAGAVTIASSSAVAFLAPGAGSGTSRLTIQNRLTFGGLATFEVDVTSAAALPADQIVANGITINPGAQITFHDLAGAASPSGTVLTLLSNTSTDAIAGTFSNLADGSTLTVGDNTYRVSYEGGDGNDLTLTVQ